MERKIFGRVVDLGGSGVRDATVILGTWPQDVRINDSPAVDTVAGGQYVFGPAELSFVDEIDDTEAYRNGGVFALDLWARAIWRGQASAPVELRWTGSLIEFPDLVLLPAATGNISVRRSDGAAAKEAVIEVMLTADEPPVHFHFKGIADGKGRFEFGPVPRRKYSVSVDAVCQSEPPQRALWRTHDLHETLVVTLEEGRTVRGTILTWKGEPAGGYRVAAAGLPTGDPLDVTVQADDEGCFELDGVPRFDAAIAVYRPPPEVQDIDALDDLLEELHGPPLQIFEIPSSDAAPLCLALPAIGMLRIELVDTRGKRPKSGHAFLFHQGHEHTTTSSVVEPHGVVRFRNAPYDTPLEIRASIDDAQEGKLEQRFSILASGEELTLRVSGAGTVILKLRDSDTELRVRDCQARFGQLHTLARAEGWSSELRGWTAPGYYPSLEVEAAGYRKKVIEGIHVHDDAPTKIDVELEPE